MEVPYPYGSQCPQSYRNHQPQCILPTAIVQPAASCSNPGATSCCLTTVQFLLHPVATSRGSQPVLQRVGNPNGLSAACRNLLYEVALYV
jgi:hypothetical protein